MSIFSSPWCFASFKKAARASTIYCLVVHALDIIIFIYSITTIHLTKNEVNFEMSRNLIPPGLLVLSYICLVTNVLIIILSCINFLWIKTGYQRTPHMTLWVGVVGAGRILQACVGVYIIGYLGMDRLQVLASQNAGYIFGALYWLGATVAMFLFCLLAYNYIRELKATAYGGQRRHKPYMIHTNDIYSPTTTAILSSQDDEHPSSTTADQKRKLYYQRNEKRPSQTLEFESIV